MRLFWALLVAASCSITSLSGGTATKKCCCCSDSPAALISCPTTSPCHNQTSSNRTSTSNDSDRASTLRVNAPKSQPNFSNAIYPAFHATHSASPASLTQANSLLLSTPGSHARLSLLCLWLT
ncbi:MAG: hypothetical protein NTZ01_02570 [Verrucomicrobia bacterium]|nr:hypothetical protein [Verrucomicrobiota bacterium]